MIYIEGTADIVLFHLFFACVWESYTFTTVIRTNIHMTSIYLYYIKVYVLHELRKNNWKFQKITPFCIQVGRCDNSNGLATCGNFAGFCTKTDRSPKTEEIMMGMRGAQTKFRSFPNYWIFKLLNSIANYWIPEWIIVISRVCNSGVLIKLRSKFRSLLKLIDSIQALRLINNNESIFEL